MATDAYFTAGTNDDNNVTRWGWQESRTGNADDWDTVGTILNNIEGETTQTLHVISADLSDDQMNVRCEAESPQGIVYSQSAKLTVNAGENFVLLFYWETGDDQVKINLKDYLPIYNFRVDYGDGADSSPVYTSEPVRTSNYTEPGNYTVTISPGDGVVEGDTWFSGMDAPTPKSTLRDIISWGNPRFTRTSAMFSNCTGLTAVSAPPGGDWSKIQAMNNMFEYCSSMTSIDLSMWGDMPVYNGHLNETFRGASSLTSVGDLSAWKPNRTTGCTRMFSQCNALVSVDLDLLFSGGATNIASFHTMFEQCHALTTVGGINSWPTGAVTSSYRMFLGSGAPGGLDIDVSNWDISSLTSAEAMFGNSTWTDANYDLMLASWGAVDSGALTAAVKFNAGSAIYTRDGGVIEAGRARLDGLGWLITDGDVVVTQYTWTPEVVPSGEVSRFSAASVAGYVLEHGDISPKVWVSGSTGKTIWAAVCSEADEFILSEQDIAAGGDQWDGNATLELTIPDFDPGAITIAWNATDHAYKATVPGLAAWVVALGGGSTEITIVGS